MQSHHYFQDNRWSKTDFTYVFETGSKTGGSLVQTSPARYEAQRRDRLFVNEANNIPREAWEQLLIRTKRVRVCRLEPNQRLLYIRRLCNRRRESDHQLRRCQFHNTNLQRQRSTRPEHCKRDRITPNK